MQVPDSRSAADKGQGNGCFGGRGRLAMPSPGLFPKSPGWWGEKVCVCGGVKALSLLLRNKMQRALQRCPATEEGPGADGVSRPLVSTARLEILPFSRSLPNSCVTVAVLSRVRAWGCRSSSSFPCIAASLRHPGCQSCLGWGLFAGCAAELLPAALFLLLGPVCFPHLFL